MKNCLSQKQRERVMIARIALVSALGIWPPVHIALVQVFDVNPWKFGGWAMYASPKPTARLTLNESGTNLPQTVKDASAAYVEDVVAYGRFADPSRLREALASAGLEVEVSLIEHRMRRDGCMHTRVTQVGSTKPVGE
jgi:hypothetical protein